MGRLPKKALVLCTPFCAINMSGSQVNGWTFKPRVTQISAMYKSDIIV